MIGYRQDHIDVGKFQLLNNISTFSLQVNLFTPTHDGTPYLTAVFVGNNHGSWLDIVADIISGGTDTSDSFLFSRMYLSETLDIVNYSTFRQIQRKKGNFLWFQAELDNFFDQVEFVLWLESVLPNTGFYEINVLEWEKEVVLSGMDCSYCVSIPGLVSGGSLNFTGISSCC